MDGEIEFESVGSSLLLFAVSSHTLTRAISDGFLPGKSATAAVLKRSARSLARELWLLRELEQGLVRPSASASSAAPPPPLCSLIKLSPFKSVTVRASVSNLRAAAAADCREGRRTHLTALAQVSNRRRKDEEIQLPPTATLTPTNTRVGWTSKLSAFCGQRCRLLTRPAL